MQKQYLECGKIVGAHGIAGELKVQPWCDSPQELVDLKHLYIDQGTVELPHFRARAQNQMVILKLDGVNSVDDAAAWRGRVLWLDRNDVTLGEREFFIQDLIGLSVLDADTGACYGTLTDVTQTGANDVYHVTFPDGVVRLVPVIESVVIETDPAANTLKIRPLQGLFDDEN